MPIPTIFLENTIKQIISKYNLIAKKSMGQNFLINPSLTQKIISLSGDLSRKTIIEIGPGPGCLTRAILEQEHIKKLILVEKDQKFIPFLEELQLQSESKIAIFNDDILKINFSKICTAEEGIIISNLPYNISSKFLLKSCKESNHISKMIIMFQKELAERIIAQPGTKKYGRISVLVQSFFKVKKILNIGPNAFTPQPKVNSAVVLFNKHKIIPDNLTIYHLEKATQLLFSKRRKKLSSILSSYNFLDELDINLNLRPENLELKDFFTIAEYLKK